MGRQTPAWLAAALSGLSVAACGADADRPSASAAAADVVARQVSAEVRSDPALGPAGLPPPYVSCRERTPSRTFHCVATVDASRLYDPPFSELRETWRVLVRDGRVTAARRLTSEIGRRRTS